MKKMQSCNVALLFVCVLFVQTSVAQEYTRWSLPEEAKTRLGEGSITDIAYSPDGAWIAVASSGIWLYDRHTGAEIVLHAEHAGGASPVAFSPDGKTLASGHEDDTVRLWEVDTGQLRATLEGHTDWVNSIAFSPNGYILASGSYDGTVRLWEASSGQSLAILDGHTGGVYSVAFSPDGKTLASGSPSGTIQLWEVSTGQQMATLKGHRSDVYSVAFSPDGKTLASGGAQDYTIRLWEVSTGQQMATIDLEGWPIFSVAFSPDGQTLASGGSQLLLWDVDTGQILSILAIPEESYVYSVAFSPDGQLLASGGTGNDYGIRLWSADTGQLLAILEGHTEPVLSVAFSPDSQLLASASWDGTILLWDMSPYITPPTSTPTHIAEVSSQPVPTTSGLDPNFPNPFNASTQIAYRLATPGLVRLEIYNVLGQPVRTLANQFQLAGFYQVRWDARDQRGTPLAAGVYLTRLLHPDGAQTRRLLYLK